MTVPSSTAPRKLARFRDSGMHHIQYRHDTRRGVDGRALAMAAVMAAIRPVVRGLNDARRQLLVNESIPIMPSAATAVSVARASRAPRERVSSLATPDIPPNGQGSREPTPWIIHGGRLIDDSRLALCPAAAERPGHQTAATRRAVRGTYGP
jgi:hypothetical protein